MGCEGRKREAPSSNGLLRKGDYFLYVVERGEVEQQALAVERRERAAADDVAAVAGLAQSGR